MRERARTAHVHNNNTSTFYTFIRSPCSPRSSKESFLAGQACSDHSQLPQGWPLSHCVHACMHTTAAWHPAEDRYWDNIENDDHKDKEIKEMRSHCKYVQQERKQPEYRIYSTEEYTLDRGNTSIVHLAIA